MYTMQYESQEELMDKAKQAEGKSFGEIDNTGRITNEKSKGHLGQIVEESFFEYEVNSHAEADFANLGIELKVTPIKQNKNKTLSAKERLVLNIINYNEEIHNTFKTSSFWTKNQKLLLMFYLWTPKVKRADYKIIKSYLHTFPEDDLAIIEQDYTVIVDKIRNGKAHELSEADTNYLAAATKGANKSSLREQPFNDIKAMQRAFSLKQGYMTALIRKVIDKDDLVRFTSPTELKKNSLLEILENRFTPFKHMAINDIAQKEGVEINYQSKSFLQQFISGLLGISGTKLDHIEEFSKANITFKTIRLEPNGLPKEHMSFRNIYFREWAIETWDDSWVKNYFQETKFLFIVCYYKETERENPNRTLYFKDIKLWNMPKGLIDQELRAFWTHVKDLIRHGVKLDRIQQKNRTITRNNLPKPKSNGYFHIRPKGKNAKDTTPLPDGREIAKQAFWFDGIFVASIINTNRNTEWKGV